MSLISIIVPVYNTERFLRRCIDSILQQSLRDFELILVDDGSTDHSSMICDEYSVKDNRVVVLHQTNGGLSAARNAGINWVFAHSSSEWITFIDSDDWVHFNYLHDLNAANEKYSTKISSARLKRVHNSADTEQDEVEFIPKIVESRQAYIDSQGWVDSYACGRLMAKELFLNVRFPEGKAWEDLWTMYKILLPQEYVSNTGSELYYYWQTESSIVHERWTVKRLDEIGAYENVLNYIDEMKDSKLYNQVLHSLNMALYGQLKLMESMSKNEYDSVKNIQPEIVNKLKKSMQLASERDKKYRKNHRKFVLQSQIVSVKMLRKLYFYYIHLRENKKL